MHSLGSPLAVVLVMPIINFVANERSDDGRIDEIVVWGGQTIVFTLSNGLGCSARDSTSEWHGGNVDTDHEYGEDNGSNEGPRGEEDDDDDECDPCVTDYVNDNNELSNVVY